MKTKVIFFKKKNYLLLSKISEAISSGKIKSNEKIFDIKEISEAKKNDISFFNSYKYINILKKTKAEYVITHKKYEKVVNKYCKPILVDHVLKAVAIVTNLFYPDSLNDSLDLNVIQPSKKLSKTNIFGNNVLIGKNVKIGKKTSIGHNSIIESNVKIGKNCRIGSNVLIKYSIIGDNVRIQDNTVIGKKGFGFLPLKNKNFRYPHIGIVFIDDDVEIGSNCTIDRGSLSYTQIGKNTFIDNQVHIAHNVKIGKSCIITAQVGFAGSSKIGNRVQIGGQAGISGHLVIGDNVQIGGGSGVVKSIADNSKVMGYPAKDIRIFLKNSK